MSTTSTTTTTSFGGFSAHELSASISRKEGITLAQEAETRYRGSTFILNLVSKLKNSRYPYPLPSSVVELAMTYLQKFYSRVSCGEVHPYEAGASCLYLAAKTHPDCRGIRLKDLVRTTITVATKQPKMLLSEQDKEYIRWYKLILYWEVELLYYVCAEISFDYLGGDSASVLKKVNEKFKASKKVVMWAQSMVNDTFRTSLLLEYPLEQICETCLFISTRMQHLNNKSVPLPKHYKPIPDLVTKVISVYDAQQAAIQLKKHQEMKAKVEREKMVAAEEEAKKLTSSKTSSGNVLSPPNTAPYPPMSSPTHIPKEEAAPTPAVVVPATPPADLAKSPLVPGITLNDKKLGDHQHDNSNVSSNENSKRKTSDKDDEEKEDGEMSGEDDDYIPKKDSDVESSSKSYKRKRTDNYQDGRQRSFRKTASAGGAPRGFIPMRFLPARLVPSYSNR